MIEHLESYEAFPCGYFKASTKIGIVTGFLMECMLLIAMIMVPWMQIEELFIRK